MNISPRRQFATSLYALLLTITLPGTSAAAPVFTNVTYGTRPYFSTGFHMDSPQAVKDGFNEYEH